MNLLEEISSRLQINEESLQIQKKPYLPNAGSLFEVYHMIKERSELDNQIKSFTTFNESFKQAHPLYNAYQLKLQIEIGTSFQNNISNHQQIIQQNSMPMIQKQGDDGVDQEDEQLNLDEMPQRMFDSIVNFLDKKHKSNIDLLESQQLYVENQSQDSNNSFNQTEEIKFNEIMHTEVVVHQNQSPQKKKLNENDSQNSEQSFEQQEQISQEKQQSLLLITYEPQIAKIDIEPDFKQNQEKEDQTNKEIKVVNTVSQPQEEIYNKEYTEQEEYVPEQSQSNKNSQYISQFLLQNMEQIIQQKSDELQIQQIEVYQLNTNKNLENDELYSQKNENSELYSQKSMIDLNPELNLSSISYSSSMSINKKIKIKKRNSSHVDKQNIQNRSKVKQISIKDIKFLNMLNEEVSRASLNNSQVSYQTSNISIEFS